MEKSDRIFGELIGLARACESNPKTKNTDAVIAEALAACTPENIISEEYLDELVGRIEEEKYAVSPGCAGCVSPCGNTSAFDMERIWNGEREAREIKRQLLEGICRAAASLRLKTVSDAERETCIDLFYTILPMVSYELGMESYLPVLSEINAVNYKLEGAGNTF